MWATYLPPEPRTDWQAQVARIALDAGWRRAKADYNTGSILELEGYLLCAIAHAIQAKAAIEIGTFIGTSALSMALAPSVEAVYTCDVSNDCLPVSERIRTYPKTNSVVMLDDLKRQGVVADLCFFDGTLKDDDVRLLSHVTHPKTVYAFHDYNYGPKIRKHGKLELMPRKGIGNVKLLRRWLPFHVLAEPYPGTVTALLAPR